MLPPLPFLLFQEAGINFFDGFRTGMIRSKGLLIDDNGALEERLSILVLALTLIEGGQVVEPGRQVRMLRAYIRRSSLGQSFLKSAVGRREPKYATQWSTCTTKGTLPQRYPPLIRHRRTPSCCRIWAAPVSRKSRGVA